MYIKISEKVKEALAQNKAVVALESTIISHGMPYPQNVETALNVERIIEENGCVPATIGIIDGVAIVGMSPLEIESFGKKGDIAKVSRRDLPICMSQKLWGATTVASTMIIAAMAKIEVFVTGGIGGVHRDAQDSFDISADLQELANTNVTVVCAGAKAILDLPLTLEYLETYGVPVLGYKSSNLASFYTRDSGLKLDAKMDSALDIAKAIKVKRDLKLDGGLVISNPILKEDELDEVLMNSAINDALNSMKEKGIKGKDQTPYLLGTVKEITKGKSLDSNIKLIYNNAKVGAKIALELSKLNG